MTTWISDDQGNRASVEFWGSAEEAKNSLDTLKECDQCDNCSDCSRCSDCSDCSDCSRCSGCSGCSLCSDCSDCYDCSGCSHCSRCSLCSDCSGCYDCSGCSRCYDCSRLKNARPVEQPQEVAAQDHVTIGGTPVPVIADIHRKVYEAASKPDALRMNSWHSCETTHCRAGWVVHLAGDAGHKLEQQTSPLFAALQIYKASGYEISPVRFFDSDEAALEDMRKLAETTEA